MTAPRDVCREALEEILNYRGGADNALDDPYVMDRARMALASDPACPGLNASHADRRLRCDLCDPPAPPSGGPTPPDLAVKPEHTMDGFGTCVPWCPRCEADRDSGAVLVPGLLASGAARERCELCGEPMPAGEEMFKFHGYSGPCPKSPETPAYEDDDPSQVPKGTGDTWSAPLRRPVPAPDGERIDGTVKRIVEEMEQQPREDRAFWLVKQLAGAQMAIEDFAAMSATQLLAEARRFQPAPEGLDQKGTDGSLAVRDGADRTQDHRERAATVAAPEGLEAEVREALRRFDASPCDDNAWHLQGVAIRAADALAARPDLSAFRVRVRRERKVWQNEHAKPNAAECDESPHGRCDLCKLLAELDAALTGGDRKEPGK